MKDKTNELTRQAYSDEQLSVEEVISFEQSLSRTDKIEIEKEKQFENSLVAMLAENTECPDAVWKELKTRIGLQSNSPPQGRLRVDGLRREILTIAALLIAMMIATALIVVPIRNHSKNEFPVLFSDDLPTFSQSATLQGDYDRVSRSLLENGFSINFDKPHSGGAHKVELLGVRYLTINKENVAQLYFSCCRKPATVLVSRKGSKPVNKYLRVENSFKTMYSVSKELRKHHLFLMGIHPPNDILDLFS